jgi:iron complex outermembrane receptor protein
MNSSIMIFSARYQRLVLCLVLFATLPAYAMEDDTFFDALPVVLSVTRLPQRLQDTPASVTVIDRAMIEASGAKEIPEVLRLVAGFQVGHVNMIGPRATVSYHGMSDQFSRRMQVLVDGRSVYTPATGGVDWYSLPVSLEDVERIEVIRGPNGVSYGANSFLGVINIITYHPADSKGTTVKAVAGEGGYGKYLLRHADTLGDLNLGATVEYFKEDSNKYFADGMDGAFKDNKAVKKLNLRGDYRGGVNDYLSFVLGAAHASLGDGVVGDPTTPLHTNEIDDTSLQLKWKRLFDSSQDIEVNLYHNRYNSDANYLIPKLSDLFGLDPLLIASIFGEDSPILVDHGIAMERSSMEFQHRLALAETVKLVWGAELRQDKVASPGLIGAHDPATTQLQRLFFNGEWNATPRAVVNAGVMVEDNTLTDVRISPRYALNYKLDANHSVRVSHTIAYRTPAILEEYADYSVRFYPSMRLVDQIWESGGGLGPEQITSTELGFVGKSKDNRIKYDVRLFREHLRDIIAIPFEEQSNELYADPLTCSVHDGFCNIASKFFNDGSVDLEGVDLQLMLKPGSDTSVSLGYSYANASGTILTRVVNDLPLSYQKIEHEVPSNTLSLLLDQKLSPLWQASVGWYYVDKMEFFGGDAIDGLKTTDLRLSRKINLGSAKGAISLTVQDINGSYYDFSAAVPRSRRAYLGAELRF